MVSIQDHVNELVRQDWKTSEGPMRLCHKLDAADFSGACLPANVRVLMERLVADGGSPATAGGNLNRAFVESVFDHLVMPRKLRESIRAVNKVLNETDVRDLHRARLVAQAAGFLSVRKKRFQPTRKGVKHLAPEQAGEFYREIFIAYFRRYNLGYDVYHREFPVLQTILPVTLWRIDAELRDWMPVQGLASRILLPIPLRDLRDAATDFLSEDQYLVGYIYEPLRRMGLLETDLPEESCFGIDEKNRIKTSRLWRKFLWFD